MRKMTFTLDADTAQRIDRTAARLGLPKSGVVREAIRSYDARAGRMSDAERKAWLQAFDRTVPRIAPRPTREVAHELARVRRARRGGGRRST